MSTWFFAVVAYQALESSNVQVFCDRLIVVWLDVFPVWMARTWKSGSPRPHTSQVQFNLKWFLLCLTSQFSLLAAERQAYFRTYIIASVAGVYSLFPLIFTPAGSLFSCVIELWLIFCRIHHQSHVLRGLDCSCLHPAQSPCLWVRQTSFTPAVSDVCH